MLRSLRTSGLVVLLLAAAFYLVENWRGARAWKSAQTRLAGAGESLDLDSFLPAPVRPEENFCATPALDGIGANNAAAEIRQRRLSKLSFEPHARSGTSSTQRLSREPLDWLAWRRQLEATKLVKPPADESDPARAVVLAFEPHEALFRELIEAARDRPHAQFDPPLYKKLNRSGLIHLSSVTPPITFLQEALELKARASLASGEIEHAAELLDVLWCCRRAMLSEPSRLIGLFATLGLDRRVTHVLLDGLRLHSWNDEHLSAWQSELGAQDPRAQTLKSLRWELADGVDFIDRLLANQELAMKEWPQWEGGRIPFLEWSLRLSPRGWLRQHQAVLTNEYIELILPALRDEGPLAWYQSEIERRSRWQNGRRPPLRHRLMIRMELLPQVWQARRVLFSETDSRLLRTACALERHFLRHHQYPGSLEALQPDLIAAIPIDLDGQPLRYARDDTNGRYRLWSVGPNLIDDWKGKTPPQNVDVRTRRQSLEDELDWVLSFPATPP